MPFIPTPNMVQARLQFAHTSGNLAENLFYCQTTDVPTATDLDEIGAAFGAWLEASWRTAHNAEWKAIGVLLRDVHTDEGLETNYTDGFPYVGSDSIPAVPLSIAYTVTWGTGLVGRSARGRTYGVGLSSSQIVMGKRLTDAVQVDLTERWGNLISIMNTAGHSLNVVSFQEDLVPRTAGRPLQIRTANARFPLANQRGRLT